MKTSTTLGDLLDRAWEQMQAKKAALAAWKKADKDA